MKENPSLVVMLTHNDVTVKNAYEIFDQCKRSKARFWGMKEEPLPLEEMKDLFSYMKKCGKTTALEVVAYTEDKCLAGAEMAVECQCDLLMGTTFSDSVNELCRKHGIRYMPFVGDVHGRPSVLDGSAQEMLAEAKRCLERGAYGVDLLGYRYTGAAPVLIREVVSGLRAPVCVAGSVDSVQKLKEIKAIAPWSFTIGGTFFERKFGETFQEQIDKVCSYMEGSPE
ncbi:MAG: hypothetical protein J6X53_08220 [Abditibacteriota bacterium]|nr:hypothetical protein [Abditibacteriota bacterium]